MYHLTIGGRPLCEHLGCMAGRELGDRAGVDQCEYPTGMGALAAAQRLAEKTKATVALVCAQCPENKMTPFGQDPS